jgi:hypothetical protein
MKTFGTGDRFWTDDIGPKADSERQLEIIRLLTELRDELRKQNSSKSKKTV